MKPKTGKTATSDADLRRELARLKRQLAKYEADRKSREVLEQTVADRTADLMEANRELQEEVVQRVGFEVALQERERWLKAIIDAFDGFIYVCSQDYRVEFMNDRFIERCGYNTIGDKCYKAIHDLDMICPWCVNDRVFQGETVRWEVKSPKDNRWLYVVNTPIHHVDGSVSKHATIIDITERKESEEKFQTLYNELNQRVSELNRVNEELRMLNYSISHDLRSPSIAVEAFSRKLLEKYADPIDPRGQKLLALINKSAVQMRELIEGLLSFFSAGRRNIRPSLVDMEALVREAIEQVRPDFGDKEIELRLLPLPPAKGDRVMLRQVLVNILNNAMKYTKSGETAIVEIGCTSEAASTVYHVRDNGIGFPMEEAGRLFHVFERLHPAQDYEGLGIGLAIVKRIVERHGGRLWAESTPGEGSTFYFSIPAGQQNVTAEYR